MKNWKIAVIALVAALATGCAVPSFNGSAIAPEIHQSKPEVVLIKDAETRDGFRQTVENWLTKNNYQYTVEPEGTKHGLDKLTIEYVGEWKWDLALFLSSAKVEAFHKGQRVGEVTYKAPNNFNTNKFSKAEERIESMLEVLFGKLTDLEATSALSKKRNPS